MVYAVLAITLFILVSLVEIPFSMTMTSEEVQSLYRMLEFFNIMVAISIAFQGWMLFPVTMSRHRLLIGALFLVVGVLDLQHTINYQGLSFFGGESSVQKATWCWVLSRFICSIFILVILSTKDKEISVYQRKPVFSFVILLLILIFTWLGTQSERLPLLITEQQEVTLLKAGMEYAASFFNLAGAVLFALLYRRDKNPTMLRFATASVYLMLGGLVFTQNQTGDDWYTIMGHVFKFCGYYTIMKAIYVSTIEEPFRRRREAELALSKSEKQLKTITNTLGEGVIVVDRAGSITFVNPEAERLLSWMKEELLGRDIRWIAQYKPPCDGAVAYETSPILQVLANGKKRRVEDAMFFRKDRSSFPVAYITSPIIEDNQVIGAVTAFRDITDSKKAEETIEKLAFFDNITDLPNRFLLEKQLAEAIREAREKKMLGAVLFVDLDRFKTINDSLGHGIGDELLKSAAERIQKCIEGKYSVARFGGDEFVIMLSEIDHVNTVMRISSSLIAEMSQPFFINGHELFTTVSIGVSLFPKDGTDPQTLIKLADVAMYKAKRLGGNHYQLYKEEMNTLTPERLALENALHHALERNELELYYQPQIETKTGRIVGMEALIRWNHPEQGVISPGVFIPLAEETGLIIPIGEWVLETACRQNKSWQEAGAPKVRVAVNLSAAQFYQEEIVDKVKSVLETSGLAAECLELEITESIAMHSVDRVIETFRELHKVGIQVSMDDFGTGYSSLSYLKHFPIKRLKIDQSFIRGIPSRADDAAIASSIIVMAHSLGLQVLGEGVETEEQRQFLAERGCDEMQGYLFSKPVPAKQAEELLKKQTVVNN